jgi:hypothetical protein
MAYTLHLKTQYHEPLQYHSATQNGAIQKGQQASFNNLGNLWFTVPGVGNVNLLDIGERRLAGFGNATWGVLIAYQGEEVEFRYEGGGQLTINVNDLGQAELSCNGSLVRLFLPPFVFKH